MADRSNSSFSNNGNQPQSQYKNPEFISFHNSPRANYPTFSPTICNSPVSTNNRRRTWNQSNYSNGYRGSQNNSPRANYPTFSPTICSSPVSTNNRRRTWNQSNYSNGYRGSQNNSGGSCSGSFNQSNHSNNAYSPRQTKNSNDISAYLHPSFTEDPWQKLEEEFKRKNTT